MALLVHQGVGIELTVAQQAAAQQLYNFFVFYTTSPDVLRVRRGAAFSYFVNLLTVTCFLVVSPAGHCAQDKT